MTWFSPRYALILTVLFVLALIPVSQARLSGERDECQSDAALLDRDALYPDIQLILDGPRSTSAENRRLTGIVESTDPRRPRMIFTITRSFGLPNGLLQPAAALPGEREPDVVEAGVVEAGATQIPVHYAYEQLTGGVRTTAYFMTHRGEPISSPLWTRLAAAPSALLSGRWPITLFVVSTRSHDAETERVKKQMNEWVRAVWTHYRAVCSG